MHLAGQQRIRPRLVLGNDPDRAGEYATASPAPSCDIQQDRLEPILLGETARLVMRIRFQTKFLTLTQEEDGVEITVLDQLTGTKQVLRAGYVLGADGGQSKVAEAIGLPFAGKSVMGNAMNVRFTADLSHMVAHRAGSLFKVIQPQRPEALGHGRLRMVQPWND